MNLATYQQLARRTAASGGEIEKQRLIAALGLVGEAGELAEMVKKEIGHGHPQDRAALAKELGDILWYVAHNASLLGLDLDEIAEQNIAKLRARYPDGFSDQDSMARRDTETGL